MSDLALPDLALPALVALPALTGALLLLAGGTLDRLAAATGVVVTGVLAGLSVPVVSARPSVSGAFMAGADVGLAVGAAGLVVLPTVTVVSLLVLLAATASPDLRTARFHGLMLLFVAAAVMTVLATTLPGVLVAWEVMGATSYALIGYQWSDPAAVAAGRTAFLTTRAADLGLYVAAGAALAGGTGMALDDLSSATPGWRVVVALGVLVACLGKAAQLPFSFWLAGAMRGPSPVSALLHSAAMVAMGGYLLLRVAPTLAATGWVDDLAAWAGASTAVLLGLVALAQRDLKQLLAASTAAQLGFVVLAAGVGATAAGTSHLVAHAAVKAGLFLAAGLWLEALGTRRLSALTGVLRRWPLVGACAAAALLSLAGLPPLALWATKDAVLAAAWEHSTALYLTGMLGAALSAAYAGKALLVLGRPVPGPQPQWDEERNGTRTVPRRAVAVLAPLAVGALVLGFLAPAAEPTGLAVSGLLAVVVVTLAIARPRRRPWSRSPVLTGWLFLEPAALRLVAAPVDSLARRLADLDDRVLDRGVLAISGAVLRLADLGARGDDRVLGGAVRGLVASVRALGRAAQRPQTGQLHQYYLQALAVLALALAVLVLVR